MGLAMFACTLAASCAVYCAQAAPASCWAWINAIMKLPPKLDGHAWTAARNTGLASLR